MKIKKYSLVVFIFCCFILLTIDRAYSQKEKTNHKISIKLHYLPKADKSTILDNITLSKILPELKKPKLLSYKDIYDEYERDLYKSGGYTFVLQGELKNDGSNDIAFIVKDKSWAKKKNVYMVIINIKGKTLTRDYFRDLNNDRAYLRWEEHYKPNMNAIFLAYDIIGSDACGIIYWNGKEYTIDTCQQLNNYEENLK
jgi:hypothetical protein